MRDDGDTWQLQEAKARLSELVDRALTTGRPQRITRRGREAVVVVPAATFQKLTKKREGTIVDFLRKSPLSELSEKEWEAILERRSSAGRTVEFD